MKPLVEKIPQTQNLEVKNQRGFLLVELLVALFFVTITVFVFLKSTDIWGRISKSNHQTIAFHVASRKIEDLRKQPFSAIPFSGSFTDPQLTKLPQGTATLTVQNYQGFTKIKFIEAKVSWFEQSVPKEAKITTLISENGL